MKSQMSGKGQADTKSANDPKSDMKSEGSANPPKPKS
jgi:hypothetical protein